MTSVMRMARILLSESTNMSSRTLSFHYLWQDRNLHAEARHCKATMARACMPLLDLERGAAAVPPAINMLTCRRPATSFNGGVIKHAKACNAFHQSLDQLLHSGWSRAPSAPGAARLLVRKPPRACPSPTSPSEGKAGGEVVVPRSVGNPYLAFSAVLMATLDGILNKIHPGDPIGRRISDLLLVELEGDRHWKATRGALTSLENDREFLKEGRRLHRRPDRPPIRAQERGGVGSDDAAPGRVRHVLQLLRVSSEIVVMSSG